ncbi:MAG TPA: PHP domain-containing protein [Dehalococcoidia bacterium]|nr:PHP domain-containing protein [Dehalococcoidia bacterium]
MRLAAGQGLKQMSISDHDSTEGLAEAFEESKNFPDLRIIPGIELSTDVPGDEIHMLGYFIQYDDKEFQDILKQFRTGRLDRAQEMVRKLAALGIVLDWERVKEIAGDGSVGRPHIALAMVEEGYCKEPKDAFPEYLGRNGLAYAERPKMTPTEGVEMLRRVGGVPVLAHPAYMNELEPNIVALKEAGLMGMEVYYAKFDADTVRRLKTLAEKYDLIPCGGSDFHGLGNADDAVLGSAGPPASTVDQLEEASQSIIRANQV